MVFLGGFWDKNIYACIEKGAITASGSSFRNENHIRAFKKMCLGGYFKNSYKRF